MPSRFMRTASVLNGWMIPQPSTPPSPEVPKMTLLESGFSVAAAMTAGPKCPGGNGHSAYWVPSLFVSSLADISCRPSGRTSLSLFTDFSVTASKWFSVPASGTALRCNVQEQVPIDVSWR
ncbi:hypothetical protein AB1Y20_005853 [Prymnesium parvum]|uniref:Ig-like domain-containing protein n=1 Tax=Prymnesium parvum TaxID=97485 RepID=A0AB34J2X5_PRYPA